MVKDFSNSVFINCPFDDDFKELLHAIIYTVYKCGFVPRSAMEEDNALINRLSKIESIIEQCRFGIHDLSRTEINKSSLPRFNMPFELGIFFGAKKFGDEQQKTKVALILEKQKYLYQQYISDLNGIDTQAHENNVDKVIKVVRNWLHIASGRKTIDGHLRLISDYLNFRNNLLPYAVYSVNLDINDLSYNDYCLMEEASLIPVME
jgi:hypothetical protein